MAVGLIMVALVTCAKADVETEGSEESSTDSGAKTLCDDRSGGSLGGMLADLEAEAGAPSLIDRPWIQECVDKRADEMADEVDRYCAALGAIAVDDPLGPYRASDLRHDLVLAYHELVLSCRDSSASDLPARAETSSSTEAEELIEQVSREWCFDPGQTLKRFERVAADRGLSVEESECLSRSRPDFVTELAKECSRGWDDRGVGAGIIYRWYDSCAIGVPSLEGQDQ